MKWQLEFKYGGTDEWEVSEDFPQFAITDSEETAEAAFIKMMNGVTESKKLGQIMFARGLVRVAPAEEIIEKDFTEAQRRAFEENKE